MEVKTQSKQLKGSAELSKPHQQNYKVCKSKVVLALILPGLLTTLNPKGSEGVKQKANRETVPSNFFCFEARGTILQGMRRSSLNCFGLS